MSSSSPDHQQNPSWQRTVLLATDSSHSIIAEVADGKTNAIAYSAYGEQSAQQEVATGLGFNGQLREARIGWYLLGNGYRAYNPRLMRFHSPDSWSPFGGGALNPYMYCVGDPVNRSDPTGHMSILKFLGHAFDFFLGGADVTGPSRRTRHQAAIVESLGGMRPENTGEGAALVTAGSVIAATAPRRTRIGSSPGGDLNGSEGSSPAPIDYGPSVPWIVSQRSSDSRPSGSFVMHHQTGSTTGGSSSHSGQAASHGQTSGMKLFSPDTFAASQQPSSYSIYPVGVSSRPPRQGTAQRGDTSRSMTGPPLVARPGGSTHKSNDRPTAAVAGVRRGSESPPPLPPRAPPPLPPRAPPRR
ncbi:RHS repeat-associated core domain-containing protein [Pseudomonas sp. IT-P176]|uniref:RHS repeat-associated core domain-containing protein n=1 Tax=Pseudomonas sp. IT-P176 TaxID=3026444 RepID=UPI0039E12CF2